LTRAHAARGAVPVCGIDFTSAPTKRKPITVAHGVREGPCVRLLRVDTHAGFRSFAAWLGRPGAWTGAFDFPFGLPRELVADLGWPQDWLGLMRHYAGLTRAQIRDTFAAYCAARPPGGKFAHRASDRPAGASPSMKWVNPPVAYMLHAGVPLLIEAGVSLPGLRELPGVERIALEGYPGLLARELVGLRSYKSDAVARQTPERAEARRAIVQALEQGRTRLGLRLRLGAAQCAELVADASGDRLDAVLCLLQAGWAAGRPGHGLPAQVDPLEGWIVTA
jgi:hypothetical protein